MKRDKITGAILLMIGVGLAVFGVVCLLAFPELTAWLILFSGVVCCIVGVMIFALPRVSAETESKAEETEKAAPEKIPFYQRPVVYGPAAALLAVALFAGVVHGRDAVSEERNVSRSFPQAELLAADAPPAPDYQAVEAIETVETPTEITAVIYGTTDTVTLASGTTVWLPFSENAEKFHNTNKCGNMNSEKATETTIDEAVRQGYQACKTCYGG